MERGCGDDVVDMWSAVGFDMGDGPCDGMLNATLRMEFDW
jgi:hypothetical protein